MTNSFPRDLRLARRSRGHALNDAALVIGTSPATMHRWETGRAMPQARWIPALADYLNVTPEELTRTLDDD